MGAARGGSLSDNSATDILMKRATPAAVTRRMRSLGIEYMRVDRTTLELILDQSGLDYARFGGLPAREVRKLLDEIDAQASATANAQFNRTDKDVATAREINRLLEMLFRGEIVDRATSDEILEILKECQTSGANPRPVARRYDRCPQDRYNWRVGE